MKVKEQVENILKYVAKTRDSDKELYIIYMQKSGMELSERQIEKFRKLPSLETIRRTRQQLQEEGKYLATPEVEKERYRKFKEMRGNIMYHDDPEKILESQGKVILPYGK